MAQTTSSITEVLPAALIDFYQMNPAAFVEDIIFNVQSVSCGGKYYITSQQREVLDSIVTDRRLSIKAGRGVGKTAMLSWLIIWWQSCYPEARVVAFAPSFPQLMSVLWPAVAKWLEMATVEAYFTHTAKKMYLNESRKTNFSEPRTASKVESAAGLHDEHLLILVDEASGVADDVFDTIQGSLTEYNNRQILMTNPTRTSGFSYDTHNRFKKIWKTFTFNSEDSPLVDLDFLAMMKEKYLAPDGTAHDMYKIHVRGEYPTGDPDAFISLEKVEKARYNIFVPEGVVEIGVDVARKGMDSTVVCVRQGNYVFSAEELGIRKQEVNSDKESMITLGNNSLDEVVDLTLDIVELIRAHTGFTDTIRIKVDDTGVGGGVTDYLDLDVDNDIEVIPCNFGGSGDENYANEASKMWGTVRDLIDDMHLPNDRFLIEELSTRRWDPDNMDKIKIESKPNYKKDYGSSPDRADALVLAFADKENERRYLKGYNHAVAQDRNLPAATLTGGDKYCAIYVSPKMEVSAVWVAWWGTTLKVIDEYIGDVADVISVVQMRGYNTKIIGSPAMFKPTAEDMFMQFMQNGVVLQEPFGYSEAAAIASLGQLSMSDNLLIANECMQVKNQVRTWTASKRHTELQETHGLCYALTLLASDLVKAQARSYDVNREVFYGSIEDGSASNAGFMSV